QKAAVGQPGAEGVKFRAFSCAVGPGVEASVRALVLLRPSKEKRPPPAGSVPQPAIQSPVPSIALRPTLPGDERAPSRRFDLDTGKPRAAHKGGKKD
ncbi:MAG: hypothetical protein BJ554DRAFT_7579, partial [Olpidium bornovanus]